MIEKKKHSLTDEKYPVERYSFMSVYIRADYSNVLAIRFWVKCQFVS